MASAGSESIAPRVPPRVHAVVHKMVHIGLRWELEREWQRRHRPPSGIHFFIRYCSTFCRTSLVSGVS